MGRRGRRQILPPYGHLAIIRSDPATKASRMQAASLGTRVRRDYLVHNFGKKGCFMAEDRGSPDGKRCLDLLRVHPSTLYKMIKEGKVPTFRIGSKWRFRKDAILRWMAEKSSTLGR